MLNPRLKRLGQPTDESVGGMGQQMYTTYPHGKIHELQSITVYLLVFMSSVGIMPMATAQKDPTLLNVSDNPTRELYQEVNTVGRETKYAPSHAWGW